MVISPLVGTLLAAAGGGAIKLAFTYFTKRLEARKWDKAYEKSGETSKEAPPAVVFAPAPPALPAPVVSRVTTSIPVGPSAQAEMQSVKVKQLLIEAELVEAQKALRRLRKSLDEAELEISQKTAALVLARSMYDEMKASADQLLQENATLRKEGALNESRNRQHAPGRHGDVLSRGSADRHVLRGPPGKGGRQDR